MTTHDHAAFIDLIPAYALGCLDPDEADRVAAHLADCAACRTELAAYASVVDALALAAPEAAPPPRLKQRLLNTVAPAAPPVAQPARPAARPPAARGWRRRLAFVWQPIAAQPLTAVLALLLLLLAAGWLWQARRAPDLPGTRLALVSTTAAAPAARGLIHISADGDYGTIIVEDLPQLGEDQQYQLWLILDGERTDGGVFSTYGHGYASKAIRSPRPLGDYEAFGVTIEPAGGSPQPTGPRVLASNP